MLSTVVQDRAVGALLGLAVGNALGTTLEFSARDTRPHHTELTGGGPFHLAPGQWTDDTAMALALADSLMSCRGFNAYDLMTRFVAWWREGAYSCTGTCFDIGRATAEALARFEQTGNPYAGSKAPMRLAPVAPVALFALHEAELAIRIARDQSRTTHAASEALAACTFLVTLLREAILDEPDMLRPRTWTGSAHMKTIAKGESRNKQQNQIRSSGYVMDTLEAVLWAVSQNQQLRQSARAGRQSWR